jgi:DNA polymerase III delta prime subunit
MPHWEPKTWANIVWPSDHCRELIEYHTKNKELHHLILYGPPGTGKTTTARLIPTAYVPDIDEGDILRLSATARATNVSVVDKVSNFASVVPFNLKWRFILIDEFDNYNAAIARDMKNLIKYNDENVMFVLTTNNLDAVEPAVRSRCEPVYFGPLQPERWMPRIRELWKQAGGMPVEDAYLLKLAQRSRGNVEILLSDLDRAINTVKRMTIIK